MKGVVGGVLKASDRFFDEESEVTEVPAPRRERSEPGGRLRRSRRKIQRSTSSIKQGW